MDLSSNSVPHCWKRFTTKTTLLVEYWGTQWYPKYAHIWTKGINDKDILLDNNQWYCSYAYSRICVGSYSIWRLKKSIARMDSINDKNTEQFEILKALLISIFFIVVLLPSIEIWNVMQFNWNWCLLVIYI